MEAIVEKALEILKNDSTLKEVEMWDKSCDENGTKRTVSIRVVRNEKLVRRNRWMF